MLLLAVVFRKWSVLKIFRSVVVTVNISGDEQCGVTMIALDAGVPWFVEPQVAKNHESFKQSIAPSPS